MNRKVVLTLSVLPLPALVAAAYVYFTPHLTLRSMKAAAEQRDATAFSQHVDFPAVRQSLKVELKARLATSTTNQSAIPFQALGGVFAEALLEQMVDTMIRPETLAVMFNGEGTPKGGAPAAQPGIAPDVEVDAGYDGPNHFVITVRRRDSVEGPVKFVLARDGVLQWKLAAVDLP